MAAQNLDVKKSMIGGTTDKAKVFDFSPLNEFVGVNCQLINHHSSDFNKFEIPLTDTHIQKKKCSKTSIVKWLSYTVNRPPSNAQQEGQAQSIPNLFFDDADEWRTTNTLPFRFLFKFAQQNTW